MGPTFQEQQMTPPEIDQSPATEETTGKVKLTNSETAAKELGGKKRERRSLDHPLGRLAVLGLLLFLIDSWCDRHFAVSLLKEIPEHRSVVIISALFVLLTFLGWKSAKKRAEESVRRYATLVLTTPFLGGMVLVFFTAASSISSLSIAGLAASEAINVKVRAAGEKEGKNFSAKGEITKQRLATNPFGKAYIVECEGYLPYSFDLYPWIGTRINLPDDLKLTPTVLVRVSLANHSQLDGGRIELRLAGEKNTTLGHYPTDSHHASVLFGRHLALDSEFPHGWAHELRAVGADDRVVSEVYLMWRQPAAVPLKPPLQPGTKLIAEFLTAASQVEASSSFTVSSERMQDILLTPSSP
jgi:hypothetical protein